MSSRCAAALAASPLFDQVRTTHANFVIVRCRTDLPAAVVVEELAARKVWVRDCQPFRLEGWLRISVGTADDLRLLTDALAMIQPDDIGPAARSARGVSDHGPGSG